MANANPVKLSDFLNKYAVQGWQVVTMETDIRRLFLFWRREAYLVIMEREGNEIKQNFF
nr:MULTISPECIES: DUF4177 domain-containing protein [unclassified Gilliamella]